MFKRKLYVMIPQADIKRERKFIFSIDNPVNRMRTIRTVIIFNGFKLRSIDFVTVRTITIFFVQFPREFIHPIRQSNNKMLHPIFTHNRHLMNNIFIFGIYLRFNEIFQKKRISKNFIFIIGVKIFGKNTH